MKLFDGKDGKWALDTTGERVTLTFSLKIFSFSLHLTPEQAKMFAAELERAADKVQSKKAAVS